MLNSLIYRKKTTVQEGESSYDSWSFEYERPARSAIEELAPANTFYAEGRRVKVDQVDMTVSEVETWRFCNNCTHKEMLGTEEEKEVCVNCGSPMWSDAGQKHLMLRMRQVFASTSDQKSRISDDSDDRDPTFYNKQMLVEFDDKQVMEAFKVDADFPFGFDFLSKVDFCEINFGEKTEIGEKTSIAGIDLPRKGFKLCRVCGKVQEDNGEPTHALTCTARDKESDKNLIDCMYLYRQFVSEAIRILLPVSIISDSERKLQAFIAAIQLGLKKRFRGKIDHLQTTVHEEPLAESSFKRKYLVLYDTVPGGTGYLKQLMRSEKELMGVLELALEALKSCSCNQEEGKDGCYRCLFAYRNSYNMKETSRDTAIELLAEILSYKDSLVKTGNIRDISMNTYIESELEARFIGALKKKGSKALPVQLKNDLVNGKPGYFLKVGDRAYYIEPQVKLGELNGVSIESRADFVIRSARLNDGIKPIVMFLDGFTYHRDRIGKDMAQRMAILQSNKFHLWSLSWHDVEDKFKPQKNFYTDFLDPSDFAAGASFNQLLEGYKLTKFKKLIKYNSFDLLIRFLENPEEERWQQFMFVVSLLHANPTRFNNAEAIAQWTTGVETFLPEEIADKVKEAECPCLYGEYQPVGHNGQLSIIQALILEKNAVAPPVKISGIRVGCCLYDGEEDKKRADFQKDWNGFLRLYNFYQFLPCSYFVTSNGLATKEYDNLKLYNEPVVGAEEKKTGPDDTGWTQIKELTDETFHSLLDTLKKEGWPVPEAGYELEGTDGEIIGSAELAWEELKVAFLTADELEYLQAFTDTGWKSLSLQDVLDNPDKYMNLKNNQGE
jgi:DEAD/DEAH box helicase domain-containing protein